MVRNSIKVREKLSSTFFRESTDGLTRPCSISEMVLLVTPARLATSRCDRPYMFLKAFSRVPMSFSMGRPFLVLRQTYYTQSDNYSEMSDYFA